MSETMRAVVWTGDRAEVRDVPRLPDREGWVRIDVAYTGICGTDLHIVAGLHPRSQPGVLLGHEFVGRVAAGQHRAGWEAGTPVFVDPLVADNTCATCRAGDRHLCERLLVLGVDMEGSLAPEVMAPIENLVRLPDSLDLRIAALIEPIATARRAVRKSGVGVGDRVHVIGAGPIGVIVGELARASGAVVSYSELAEARAAFVRDRGFALIAAPSGDDRVDVLFDCVGHPAVAPSIVDAVRTSGTIVVVGIYPGRVSVDLQEASIREISILGTKAYSRADIDAAVALVASGTLPVADWISAEVTLDETPAAMERLGRGEGLKVVVRSAS